MRTSACVQRSLARPMARVGEHAGVEMHHSHLGLTLVVASRTGSAVTTKAWRQPLEHRQLLEARAAGLEVRPKA